MPLPSELTPGPDHKAPRAPVEPKVKAGTVGAGAGAAVSAFLVWVVDEVWFNGEGIEPEVPFPIVALIGTTVTSGLAFASGYRARHVNR